MSCAGVDASDLLSHNAVRTDCSEQLSPYFKVAETATAGRAAFASRNIAQGCDVFRCDWPFAHIIYKRFRKEVCASCFRYDGGRKMKVAFMSGRGKDNRGIAWFCSEGCKDAWETRIGQDGLEAVLAIHGALARVKKATSVGDARQKPLLERDIETAWQNAEARSTPKDIRLIDEEDNEETLLFLLDGMLARKRNPPAWSSFLSLNPTLAPYQSNPSVLASHIRYYDFLRVHLPSGWREACTPATILALVTRDAGNSFGIWEQGVEDDGEMLGYGVWVEASFFNHSCEPNLKKRIEGPVFDFYTLLEVDAGAELCINYIGDAKDSPREERQRLLETGWGFICQCTKCSTEAEASATRQAT